MEDTNKTAVTAEGTSASEIEERTAWYSLFHGRDLVAMRLMTDSELKEAQQKVSEDYYWQLRQDIIAVQYGYPPVEIRYSETENNWQFTLRGKDRTAETLANAKKAIDAPVREDRRVFKKFEAFLRDHNRLLRVTVTGLASSGRYRRSEKAWIRRPDGKRDTVYISYLLHATPENEKLVAQIEAINAQKSALYDQEQALMKQLTPVTISDEDYD